VLPAARIEFACQIRSPVAVKIGPAATTQDVLGLIEILDPGREPGRLTLITRMGASQIRRALPPLAEKVAASGAAVVWVCDPMHGNTVEAASGQKTRYFDDVLDEVAGFFEVHRARCRPASGRCVPGSAPSSPGRPVTEVRSVAVATGQGGVIMAVLAAHAGAPGRGELSGGPAGCRRPGPVTPWSLTARAWPGCRAPAPSSPSASKGNRRT
jgi:hypothetical protein